MLGIDYGAKRVGVAYSDEMGSLAFPKAILENDKNLIKNILKIVEEEHAGAIVVGESLDLAGKPNQIEGEIKKFIEEIKKYTSVSIHRQKEFLTSVEARKTIISKEKSRKVEKRDKKVDASAAALILQRYLDMSANKLAQKQSDR